MFNPLGSVGAVLPGDWFDSGCGGTAKARWLPDGRIELQGVEHNALLPKAVRQWDELIVAKAKKYGVPPQFVAGIMATESSGQAELSSYAGAGGLMGLMPNTASWLAGRAVSLDELLSNHDLNVDLGVKLIAYLLKYYNGNIVKVALAYNAGSVMCGAPKKCPDAPNQWNAVTDCTGPKGVGGKAVDYPARMFKFSNDWRAAGGPASGLAAASASQKAGKIGWALALGAGAVVGVALLKPKLAKELLKNNSAHQKGVIQRAAMLLGYMTPKEVYRHLVDQGVRAEDAALALRAAQILVKDRQGPV